MLNIREYLGLANAAWAPLSAALTDPTTLKSQSPAVLDILRVLADGEAKYAVVQSVGMWSLSADAGVETLVGVLAAFAPELMKDGAFVEVRFVSLSPVLLHLLYSSH